MLIKSQNDRYLKIVGSCMDGKNLYFILKLTRTNDMREQKTDLQKYCYKNGILNYKTSPFSNAVLILYYNL